MKIIQALANQYERLKSSYPDEIPSPGYSFQRMDYELVLGKDVHLNRLGVSENGKHDGMHVILPYGGDRSSVEPRFLWDNSKYVFGLDTNYEVVMESFNSFKELHFKELNNIDIPIAAALIEFLKSWDPKKPFFPSGEKFPSKALGKNFVFRLDVDSKSLHQNSIAINKWKLMYENIRQQNQIIGNCSITGQQDVKIAKHHPKIKGFKDDAPLVSFKLNCFKSYGKKEGLNAAMLEEIVFKYAAVLNFLLRKGSMQKIWQPHSRTVFWAETDGHATETEVRSTESMFARLSNSAINELEEDETDEAINRLYESLKMVTMGKMSKDIDPNLNDNVIISILELSPNKGRISIRNWHRGRFGDFAKNLVDHWDDLLLLDNKGQRVWKVVPSAWSLSRETVGIKEGKPDIDNISPLLAGQILTAILDGKQFPLTFLQAIIRRIKAEKITKSEKITKGMGIALSSSFKKRVAICKAYLTREFKNQNRKVCLMKLNKNITDIPYLLGRLFACYSYAESSYMKRNTTIDDKFLASASATPAIIFPQLDRGFIHNKSALAKTGDKRVAFGQIAEKTVREIRNFLPGDQDDFPKTLSPIEQSQFFTAYYHQIEDFYTKKNHSGVDHNQEISSEIETNE